MRCDKRSGRSRFWRPSSLAPSGSSVENKDERTMKDYLNFNGKVALVTGAASGMGLATARAFAEAGAAVVLADVRGALVQTAAEELVANGHRAIGVSCDVSDDAQVAAMVDRTVAEFGRLDAA